MIFITLKFIPIQIYSQKRIFIQKTLHRWIDNVQNHSKIYNFN